MAKHLVKSSVSFLLILIFAGFAAAQEENKDESQCVAAFSPRLHGLVLGMSPAEVQAVLGNDLKIKVKTSGERSFFQNYVKKNAPASLSGVRALYLRFLDGRLYQIEIFYEERSDVTSLEVFAANLSAQLNLPAGLSWQFTKNKAVIDCRIFTVVAEKLLNPRVELTDTAKRDEARARRKKSE